MHVSGLGKPRDPPSAQASPIGVATAFGVPAQEDASPLPRLELFVLSLAGALGLLLLLLAVVPIHRLLLRFPAVVPIHRLAGIAASVAARPIAVALAVVVNSILVGILIAQLGA